MDRAEEADLRVARLVDDLLQVQNSLRDHVGSGESMQQLMYFNEGYTVDKAGTK